MSRLVSVMFGSQAGAAAGLYGDSLLRAGRRTGARNPLSANSRARSCRSTDRVAYDIPMVKEVGSNPPQHGLQTAHTEPCAEALHCAATSEARNLRARGSRRMPSSRPDDDRV